MSILFLQGMLLQNVTLKEKLASICDIYLIK